MNDLLAELIKEMRLDPDSPEYDKYSRHLKITGHRYAPEAASQDDQTRGALRFNQGGRYVGIVDPGVRINLGLSV